MSESACLASVTPSAVAGLLRESPWPQTGQFEDMDAADEKKLLSQVQAADKRGKALTAVDLLLDLQEFHGDKYSEEIIRRLTELYPMGDGSRVLRNQSEDMRRSLLRSMSKGVAERLSESPPIYLLRDLLSKEEAGKIMRAGIRRRKRWTRHSPLVCFQHDAYTGHEGLQNAWETLTGSPGAGARGCLTQAASSVVAPALQYSESLSIFRGQESRLDRLGATVQSVAGLHQNNSHAWQLLSYHAERHGGYAEHTDCTIGSVVHNPGERLATLLLYLTDDFDGGETEFPRLGLRVKPPVGSALVFYNFGPGWGGRQCHGETVHRSNTVTRGNKMVLQRWYAYPEQPFLSARPIRPAVASGMQRRRPFQPVVSCDYTHSITQNVSCRWYNHDSWGAEEGRTGE